MSTNDEIRKAVKEQAELLSARCAKWAENRIYPDAGWIENVFMETLAPYLAPHPAQQGEDTELLDWLATHGMPEVLSMAPNDDDDDNDRRPYFWVRGEPLYPACRTPRDAIRAARARSHSKQEGGA